MANTSRRRGSSRSSPRATPASGQASNPPQGQTSPGTASGGAGGSVSNTSTATQTSGGQQPSSPQATQPASGQQSNPRDSNTRSNSWLSRIIGAALMYYATGPTKRIDEYRLREGEGFFGGYSLDEGTYSSGIGANTRKIIAGALGLYFLRKDVLNIAEAVRKAYESISGRISGNDQDSNRRPSSESSQPNTSQRRDMYYPAFRDDDDLGRVSELIITYKDGREPRHVTRPNQSNTSVYRPKLEASEIDTIRVVYEGGTDKTFRLSYDPQKKKFKRTLITLLLPLAGLVALGSLGLLSLQTTAQVATPQSSSLLLGIASFAGAAVLYLLYKKSNKKKK